MFGFKNQVTRNYGMIVHVYFYLYLLLSNKLKQAKCCWFWQKHSGAHEQGANYSI